MPFRASFDCLWCGQSHVTRSANDIEGWASLCPDCLGRAQENGFLKARLRAALRERSSTTATIGVSPPADHAPATQPAPAADPALATHPAPPPEPDGWPDAEDFYLRRGRFARGPIIDVPWQTELDQVTRWLDGVALSGVIVELAAATGWWSPLLAQKGELWVYEADDEALDLARRRLVAHGLRAHLHRREAAAPPDRQVDVVFAAFLLGALPDDAGLAFQLEVVRRWLRPGGVFIFVEAQPGAGAAEGAAEVDGPRGRLRGFRPIVLRDWLTRAGFGDSSLQGTAQAFLMGQAVAAHAGSPADP